MSIQVVFPFFSPLVCFSVVELYEPFIYLDINSILIISFTSIFSHSVGYLFVSSMVSFALQKLLSLVRCHLCIFLLFPLL